jgi:hypothetical protein
MEVRAMGREYKTQQPGVPSTPAERTPAAMVVLAGIGDPMSVMQIAGRDVPINEIVEGAFETSGLSLEEWNAAEPTKRDELIAGKRKEFETMFRAAGDLPGQDAAREQAQAAVAARRAQREAKPAADGSPAAAPTPPHSSEVDPASLAAPKLCSDGWLVPTIQKQLPQNFR